MMGHAWLKHREALLAVVIILMIGAIGSRAPSFVSPGNLVEMFNDTSILIILALGQMMVLLTKGIDLSMAANLALTGMIVALLNAHYPGIPVVVLLALATLLGLLMGVINGLLVWRLVAGPAAAELVRHRRTLAGRLFLTLQPHRASVVHRRRQRHGGVLHRD